MDGNASFQRTAGDLGATDELCLILHSAGGEKLLAKEDEKAARNVSPLYR